MTRPKTLPHWLTRDLGSRDLKLLSSGFLNALKRTWHSHPKVTLRWDGDHLIASHPMLLNKTADCLLEIPEARTLSFDLPPVLAAEPPSASLILAQISNWTPFSADEVWLLPPDYRAGNLRECLYVPKRHLAAPLATATREAIRVDGIVFEARPGASVLFEGRAGWVRRLRHHALALMLACLPVSLGIFAWAYLSRIEREEFRFQQRVVQLLGEARKGTAIGNDRLDQIALTVKYQQPSADLATLLIALPAELALHDVAWQANRFLIRIDESEGTRLIEAMGSTKWSVKTVTRPEPGKSLVELVPQ